MISCTHLACRWIWRHYNVIKSQKIWFKKIMFRNSIFNWSYLHYSRLIFSEFSVWCRWYIYQLKMYSSLFILTRASWSKFQFSVTLQKHVYLFMTFFFQNGFTFCLLCDSDVLVSLFCCCELNAVMAYHLTCHRDKLSSSSTGLCTTSLVTVHLFIMVHQWDLVWFC